MSRLICIILVSLILPLSAAAAESKFQEGKDYVRYSPPVPVSTGKIEVLEFFSYGCPHCRAFEPYFEDWKKKQPVNVEVRQVPSVMGGAKGQLIAKAFYAAERMGVLDKIHSKMFDAIQVEHVPMNTEEQIGDWVKKQGIDEKAFLGEMQSFDVDTQVRKITQMMMAYRITGVPSVTIDGRYLTSGGMAGDFGTMVKVMDYLVDREIQARKAAKSNAGKADKTASVK